jgi:5-methylcytosine-specific restriction endonuclease McrA
MPVYKPCEICETPTYSSFGICKRSPACRTALRIARRKGQSRGDNRGLLGALKYLLALRDGFTCNWCGKRLPSDLNETNIDHIVPCSVYHCDDHWNLQILHEKCNKMKSSVVTDNALILAAMHGIGI